MSVLAIIFTVLFFISGIGLLATVMMHSGEGEGIADSVATSLSGVRGTSIISRNLDRLTVVLAVVFFVSVIFLMMVFPQGSIATTA